MQARMHNIYASTIVQTGGNVPVNDRTVVQSTYHPFWNAGVNGSNEVRSRVQPLACKTCTCMPDFFCKNPS